MEAIFFCIGAASVISLLIIIVYIIHQTIESRRIERIAIYGTFFFLFLAFTAFGIGGYVDNLGKIEQCSKAGGAFVNDNCENWSK